MPEIRAFRALRYNPEVVPDLARVVAPPYDVISPARRAELAARDPRNVVAIDLPVDAGASDPDEKYRAAARIFAAWRADGTLGKDRQPSLYVYEMDFVVPGTTERRVQRGFYGRLRLEDFGPGGGILPHERTLAGPREDRHKLMRATGANFSGVMFLYADASGVARRVLAEATEALPVADVTDHDGVRHRLWMLPDEGATAPAVAALREVAGREPVTIADGHHRYETALRYRDERRMTRSSEDDPAFDFLLALFLDAANEPILVLPTHRVARDVAVAGGLVEAAEASGLFAVEPVDRGALLAAFGPGAVAPGGRGESASGPVPAGRCSTPAAMPLRRSCRPAARRSGASTSRCSRSCWTDCARLTGPPPRSGGASRSRRTRPRRWTGSMRARTTPMQRSSWRGRRSRRSRVSPATEM